MRQHICRAIILCLCTAVGALAQQTSGNITGRIVDQQGAAIPGATVTAKNADTGLTRSEISDAEGVYRLNALPVGAYDITAELQGFNAAPRKQIAVNVSQTITLDFTMSVAALAESVTVTGATPMVETTSSSVGAVVDLRRVESLPLNGRQFANLAATIPGVGLGFHSDPTKSTQYSPQINGGNGRNVNYQIDGGDNNDDTVGGLLQQFPLEAIDQFNFITQRFKAEYGRSNGGVMNIVTKSGTNDYHGSVIEFFRDKTLNATTTTEATAGSGKQDYRRNQYGGSFGGPLVHDRLQFFAALERTGQETKQTVNTLGLFPALDGVYPTPYSETLFSGKATANLSPAQYLTVRYGFNQNSQPYGAASNSTPDDWGLSHNRFNSVNLNHNWVLGGARLNEFIFQFADFGNQITANSNNPYQIFPNTVTTGQSINTPQTTEQRKFQFRDDFSWHASGTGLGHDFKTGVNFINEPHLFITFNTAKGIVQYTHLDNTITGPIQQVQVSDGNSFANLPTKQYAVYLQDDWRVSNRVTFNLGVRYDFVSGVQFDQSANPNFVTLQAAGAAGRFANVIGMEDFGKTPQNDRNNIQPRAGVAWDVRGNGRDVVRGGWGIYTDFGYTNSNGLFAGADALSPGFGPVFQATNTAGLRNRDGSLYQVGQPTANLTNEITNPGHPLVGQIVSPRLQQPEQWQTNAGISHQLSDSMVVSGDYVHADGKNLNVRAYLNTRPDGGPRRFADLALSPNTGSLRPAVSRGKSRYDAMILSLRQRMTKGVDFTVAYTLANSKSNIGTASDELNAINIQDARDPFDAPVQFGPTLRTDARHRMSASAVIALPAGFQLSPFWIFRSALPVNSQLGYDANNDANNDDITTRAFAYNPDDPSHPIDIGACTTINCSRGYRFSQVNVRLSKSFSVGGHARAEAIAEVFNLFNNANPVFPTANAGSPQFQGASLVPNANFMQPINYAGDFRQTEQRVGQIGVRFTF